MTTAVTIAFRERLARIRQEQSPIKLWRSAIGKDCAPRLKEAFP
jgi:hypothetical protein